MRLFLFTLFILMFITNIAHAESIVTQNYDQLLWLKTHGYSCHPTTYSKGGSGWICVKR